jgi:hypothetical protein
LRQGVLEEDVGGPLVVPRGHLGVELAPAVEVTGISVGYPPKGPKSAGRAVGLGGGEVHYRRGLVVWVRRFERIRDV